MTEITPQSSLQQTVDEITGYSRRTRKLIWGLVISIALDIALTVVLGFTAFQAHDATHNTQVTVDQALTANNARWCSTMKLLTATPVPYPANAAANPSRVATYQLYEDFVALKKEFGCG
jgi:hypothetical protein